MAQHDEVNQKSKCFDFTLKYRFVARRKSRAFYLQGNSCIPTKETMDKLDSRCCNQWECNYLRASCLRRWVSTGQVWWRFTCCHSPMEMRIRCASSMTPTIAHSLSLDLSCFLSFFLCVSFSWWRTKRTSDYIKVTDSIKMVGVFFFG